MDATIPYEDGFSRYKRTERQEMMIAAPLDLSFKKATTMKELADKRPQAARTGKIPLRTPTDRFVTCSLWLSNNLLTSMDGFESFAHKLLDEPVYLSWLDVSFNEIKQIGDDIMKFPNLKIIYLHGNNISNINDVVKLKNLQNLRSLTLHGNPIENLQYYRGYIVHILPQLSALDFSAVLSAEKKRAPPAGFYKVIYGTT
ncbi:PREDICTED: leucine-rich repeat-containing protein 51-like [Dufourea novaeangliae]|uniref:Leucine-rich repeat-containing protein 51 n=1 Tax=Dufourea novaeangliae TaxID=178035 RepID=A0A154PGK4_DUFNO|nr:PREDICTED: leucine-rich repeat-containing protein 51-like [Dufourea novaeangliae]KZC10448.1 Leucine-rich repeat-containing protein 51 [Dufourea novaeangliae]